MGSHKLKVLGAAGEPEKLLESAQALLTESEIRLLSLEKRSAEAIS